MRTKTCLFGVLSLLVAWSCGGSSGETSVSPSSNAGRTLAIDINEAEDGNFEAAYSKARNAGSQAVSISVQWDEIEKSPNTFAPDPNWLQIANQYYPRTGISLTLAVNPIDTNQDRRPADLKSKSFSDPEVIRRFKSLLDYVFSQIPDLRLTAVAIGNEIDAFLGPNVDQWEEYRGFLVETAVYAKTKRDNLIIGSKVTFPAFVSPAAGVVRRLNEASDVYMVTYYPLNADFTVRDPSVVRTDLSRLIGEFSDKPFYFLEAGYPSSAACRSSEAKQADFIRQFFAAWDEHSSRIPYLSFTWLHDISPSAAATYGSYYGVSNQKFVEYLRTLGLRTYSGSGQDKEAYRVLKDEAKQRGW